MKLTHIRVTRPLSLILGHVYCQPLFYQTWIGDPGHTVIIFVTHSLSTGLPVGLVFVFC
jgi:hypothetical protein